MNNYNQDGLHFNETDSKPEPRPGFLTFLCILTFIGSGFSVLSQLFSYIYYDKIPILFEQVASVMGGQLEEAYLEMAEIFIAIPRYYFIVLLAVYALAVVEAVYMFIRRKIGFHLYVISQILLLALPLLILHSKFNVVSLFFPLLFILLYARYLKWMK